MRVNGLDWNDEAIVRQVMTAESIPTYMQDGLLLWINEGIEPGSFMAAVLSNNLREACSRADDTNRHLLYEYVHFLYNYAPVGSWGSEETVRAWAKMNMETRRSETVNGKA